MALALWASAAEAALLPTTTSLASDTNPSIVRQTITFTAVVAGTLLSPTGTVTFRDGATILGTSNLSSLGVGTGQATFSTSALLVGSHTITAVYSGDDLVYNTSASAPYTQFVNLSATATTVYANINPLALGQLVTLSAKVSGCVVTPVGSITFKNGATTLGTGVLDASGNAIFTSNTLPTGVLPITAVFAGDNNCASSGSATLNLTVNPGLASASVVSSQNPATFNQTVTFTAKVTSAAPFTPTGSVTFKDGATTLGTGTLSGGQATFSTNMLAVGSHAITAVYGGDTNFAAGTSPGLTQIVSSGASTTTLMSSLNPSALNQTVTFTATVGGVGAIPTGTVTFKDGAATLGTATLNGSGQATFSTSALGVGGHSITAAYGGDSNFSTSTSPVLTQNVTFNASTTALTSSANPSAYNQSVTFTATVTGSSGTPDGSVTFKDGATTLGIGTLSGGQAAFSTAALLPGNHSITAEYSGSTVYGASMSTPYSQTVSPGNTTTTVTASPNPSAFWQSVTFTASVSGTGVTPTGTVTFKDGATTLGIGALDGSGQATFSTSALTVGSHAITAVYGGDTNFATSTSSTLTHNVTSGASTTTLMSSLNPSAQSQTIIFTATVGGVGATATGTVTFKDGAATLGAGTLNGSGQATFSTSTLAVGSHAIIAVYGGDTNFTTSTSSTLTQIVTLNASTTALASSANPSVYNQSVTFTATVTSSGGTPGGSVTFKDGATTLGTGMLSGGQAVFSTAALLPGYHSITAEYSGNMVYGASTSTAYGQTVSQGSTTTTVTASINPSAFGQSVTFTASVSGAGAMPTGTVTFKDGATTFGIGTLDNTGRVTFATNTLAVGSHAITAVYGSDTNFTTSTSPALTHNVTTNASTTALSTSLNPSAVGQSVTFTATVSGAGGPPTGTVTFKDGATTLGTGTLGGGQTTYTTNALTFGSHSITAVYGGDGNFDPSTSPVLVLSVNANDSNTALTSSPNPATLGQPVTYIATVTGSAGTPGGTVTFKDAATIIGTATLNGIGQATLTNTPTVAGNHMITAVYSGDGSYGGSMSAPLTQTINPGGTGVTLTSSVNPSTPGQPVTFLATVTGAAGIPTGVVVFKDGPATLGTGTLDGSGQATFTANTLSTGSHAMRAFYAGDSNFAAGSSPTVTQTVNASVSTATLASSLNPSAAGQTVTFTATVGGAGGTPTGTVTFKDGATALATSTLSGAGTATFATGALSIGSHQISVTYAGDSNYTATVSTTLTQNVSTSATTTSLTSSLNPSAPGQTVTFTATVGGTGGTPTGTITFKDGATTLATRTLAGSGVATYATSALALGNHSITAVYGGSTQFGMSTSAAVNQAVGIPLDSLRLRAFQVLATKMAAQTSGQATAGAIEAAVAEGFSDDGELFKPNELGLRMNFSADAREDIRTDELNKGAFSDVLKKQEATPQRAPPRRYMKEWLAWAEIRNTGWMTGPQNADTKGAQINMLAGLTYRITPDLLVGIVGGRETFNYTSRSLDARLYGTGASIGAYSGWRLRPGIRMEASIVRSTIDYNGTSGAAAASFPGTRWLFTGGVTGTDRMQGFDLEPSLRVYYLTETEKGYTDSLGTTQRDRAFSTGRASAGIKMTYPWQRDADLVLAPYVGLYADYYFTKDNAGAPDVAIVGVDNEILQGWSARLISGIAVKTIGGISASLGGEFGGIGSNGGLNVWSIRGRTAIPF